LYGPLIACIGPLTIICPASADSCNTAPKPVSGWIANRSPSNRTLNDLAEAVADEFEAYRHSDGFNEIPFVIDNSDREHSTLIVHIDREQVADLADHVETFLRDHSAQTQRERHTDTDIRVLATLD